MNWLLRLAISLESLADEQHVHFRAIAPHRAVTGGQHDSSTFEGVPRQSGPACTFHRQAEAPSIHLVQAELIAVFGTLETAGRIGYDSAGGVETVHIEQTLPLINGIGKNIYILLSAPLILEICRYCSASATASARLGSQDVFGFAERPYEW